MKEYSACVAAAFAAVKARVPFVPQVAIILGSGLGELAEAVNDPIIIPYGEIPGWKVSTAPGHIGRLLCGTIGGVPVVVMQGRLHCYEGYTPWETTLPVRVFGLWGVKTLIVTNASGGVNWDYSAGDVALITDHINLTGLNPLTGPNNTEWGPRFPDMSEAYSKRLLSIAKEAAAALQGADIVGMSTVHEVIAANHMGMEVCGISCVSNQAAGMNGGKLSHQEVLDQMSRSSEKVAYLISKMLELYHVHDGQ